jgi:hypothetical protein
VIGSFIDVLSFSVSRKMLNGSFLGSYARLTCSLERDGDENGTIAEAERDEEDEEEEEEIGDNTHRETQDPEGNSVTAGLQEIGRPVSQWTPDQNLNNFLFDIVSMSDTRGLSTMV